MSSSNRTMWSRTRLPASRVVKRITRISRNGSVIAWFDQVSHSRRHILESTAHLEPGERPQAHARIT